MLKGGTEKLTHHNVPLLLLLLFHVEKPGNLFLIPWRLTHGPISLRDIGGAQWLRIIPCSLFRLFTGPATKVNKGIDWRKGRLTAKRWSRPMLVLTCTNSTNLAFLVQLCESRESGQSRLAGCNARVIDAHRDEIRSRRLPCRHYQLVTPM